MKAPHTSDQMSELTCAFSHLGSTCCKFSACNVQSYDWYNVLQVNALLPELPMRDLTEIDSGTRELLAEIRGRVAILTLNRPEARNALSDQLTPALRKLIKRFGDDPQVGAILITGAGDAFLRWR